MTLELVRGLTLPRTRYWETMPPVSLHRRRAEDVWKETWLIPLLAVQEFVSNMYDSPFGDTFNAYSESILSQCSNTEIISRLAFMQLGPNSPSSPGPRYKYGRASSVSNDQLLRWIEARLVRASLLKHSMLC